MSKSLLLAWVTACIAMISSLYMSEVLEYIPCTLCWYQRILMYPLAIILGVAFYKQDLRVTGYALPLSLLGILISGYHIALQKVPALKELEACKAGVPCSQDYLNWFGFITIPMLSFIAFVIITVCLFFMKKQVSR
ncbi:thiol-disulfide oxidoreductase BdbC [Fictibacillus macauensis ZFHKF-1]|uniref:Thiol-disulfide oxidoreductase BdbC n=1 Tax=Fictibacillus macauensis ZFHKF-1 TaxID=1196324 RepID=I8IWG1_9BACL|nr:disulfide oxidoreductase [Fictibacillus macauensis]EIT83831.1 thiol-disulfide oxidoreductase BdbC [Fictibacillus macauensis ZFHKF-1]